MLYLSLFRVFLVSSLLKMVETGSILVFGFQNPGVRKKGLQLYDRYAKIAIATPVVVPVFTYAEVLESADRHV